ncbi:hypothetical protein WJX73_000851 [Symbiochloris irregularis]|uniref:protein disulfide-isomerase n=1 Tax=Symbiochloris irregularis TaxID=706552 RepID=A0AAW1PYI1_9CHLO
MLLRHSLVLFAALGSLAGIRAADDPTGSLAGVVDLTPDNFDKYVNGAKDVLVEFYAPWCGHCKHLTPEYKKLGAAVAASPALKSRVTIAKVDADAHRSLGERFGVGGFPTLKYFHRGKPVSEPADYSGARTQQGFTDFIEKALAADTGFARVASLDSLASLFPDSKTPQKVYDDLKAKVAKLTDKTEKSAGDIYLKYAQKAVDKGNEYFGTEKSRLERLLESGKVGASKIGEISQKLSVLSAFEKVKAAVEE